MRYGLAVLLVFATVSFAQHAPDQTAGTVTAQESGSSPTALAFGDAHFTVPAGWKHVEKQAGASKYMLIVPPEITRDKKFAVLVLPGQDLPDADLAKVFDTILKQGLAANEHLVKFAEVPARKLNGYDLLTRSMIVADNAGHQSFRIGFAANPGHRFEMLIVSADSQELFTKYQAETALLLNSWSFDNATADTNAESGAAQSPARAGSGSPAQPDPQQGSTVGGSSAPPGTRSRVAEDTSVLLCSDPARLDGAMDFAKYGNSYAALQALRNDAFFRVTGPAWLEVKEFQLQSRWPKVLVKVLDGYAAGRIGWVVRSELKDLKDPK